MKQLTKKDLEKLVIIHLESKAHTNRFFHPLCGEIDIYKPYTIDKLFDIMYDSGYKIGQKYGEEKKVKDIKKVLNINDAP